MDPVQFLRRLVQIESLSGYEQEVAAYLVRQMTAQGLQASLDGAGNAVGVRECPDEVGQITREIVLLGHMDTIPGRPPVRLEDGRLYGRGTVDAKGALATFVMASQAQLAPGRRLVVIGAVEEEAPSSKGAHYVVSRYQPDLCVIGEPSGWNGVTIGYKGHLLLDYELSQPNGHTAGPQAGVAETAVAFWQALEQYAQDHNEGHDRLFERLIPHLREICTDGDGLTNSVIAKIGLRLPPNFEVKHFKNWVAGAAGEAQWGIHNHLPAFQTKRQSPLVQAFTRAIRRAGARPRLKLKTGTADMNIVGPRWQCPIVAYGPGDSRLDHRPDEHVEIKDYLRAIQILRGVLEQQ